MELNMLMSDIIQFFRDENPEIDQNIVKSVMKLRGKTEKKLKIKK